jgi:signal transduction histidine kinase
VISMGFDVSERVRAQRESERARAAAEELARTRNDFVAAVSHELRTPLTAIIGYAELLEARWRTLDDVRRQEQIRRIAAAANRQKRLVEDLLMLGRQEIEAMRPAIEATSVLHVCELAGQEVRASYRSQEITLDGPVDLQVAVDAERLIQILINLIDNAAKYSPEGSPVAVSWARHDATAKIRVRDHGVGIAHAHLPRLFTRFGRLPGSKARNGHVGTGLGLYLGRLMAEAMNCTLAMESTSAAGTVFCLSLPLSADETPVHERTPGAAGKPHNS